jgi:membrane protein YdbS with pleckstrin-like domain
MALIVRLLMAAGAAVTGLFVAADSPNYSVIQGLAAIAVLAAAVFLVALWPRRRTPGG